MGFLYFENNGTMQILARLDDPTIVIYNFNGTNCPNFFVAKIRISNINQFLWHVSKYISSFAQPRWLRWPYYRVGYRCGKIALWDIQTGLIVRVKQYASPGYGITAFSLYVDEIHKPRDLICLAASSCDGTVCISGILRQVQSSKHFQGLTIGFHQLLFLRIMKVLTLFQFCKNNSMLDIKTEELKYTINAMIILKENDFNKI